MGLAGAFSGLTSSDRVLWGLLWLKEVRRQMLSILSILSRLLRHCTSSFLSCLCCLLHSKVSSVRAGVLLCHHPRGKWQTFNSCFLNQRLKGVVSYGNFYQMILITVLWTRVSVLFHGSLLVTLFSFLAERALSPLNLRESSSLEIVDANSSTYCVQILI